MGLGRDGDWRSEVCDVEDHPVDDDPVDFMVLVHRKAKSEGDDPGEDPGLHHLVRRGERAGRREYDRLG